jgi:hypothetical protein
MATTKVGYARAVAAHTAESAEGLSLFPGDLVTLVSKKDPDAWAVRGRGRAGGTGVAEWGDFVVHVFCPWRFRPCSRLGVTAPLACALPMHCIFTCYTSSYHKHCYMYCYLSLAAPVRGTGVIWEGLAVWH